MARTKSLNGADGSPYPDDFIPRCMDAAQCFPSVFNEPQGKFLRHTWAPAFTARVDNAKARLAAGEHPNAVREIHGAIVVRQAAAELLPKAKMLA